MSPNRDCNWLQRRSQEKPCHVFLSPTQHDDFATATATTNIAPLGVTSLFLSDLETGRVSFDNQSHRVLLQGCFTSQNCWTLCRKVDGLAAHIFHSNISIKPSKYRTTVRFVLFMQRNGHGQGHPSRNGIDETPWREHHQSWAVIFCLP